MYYAYKKVKEHRRQKALAQESAQQEAAQQEVHVQEAAVQDGALDTTTTDSLQPASYSHEQPAIKETNDTAAAAKTPKTQKPAKEKKVLSPEEIADKKRRTVYRWKLVAGLFGPFALQALDTTIIASALSAIATEFREYMVSCFNVFKSILTNLTNQTKSSSSTGSSRPSTSPRPPFSSSGLK